MSKGTSPVRLHALRRAKLRAKTKIVAMTLNTPLVVDIADLVRGWAIKVTHINNIPIVDGGAALDLGNFTTTLEGTELTITPDNGFTGVLSFRYTVTGGTQSRTSVIVGEVT